MVQITRIRTKKSFSFVTNNQHLINIDKKNLKKKLQKGLRNQKLSVPLHRLNKERVALLAQLVEQLTLNQWVQGSSP